VGKSKKEVKTGQISEFCPQFAHQTKNLYKTLTGGSAPLLKPETQKARCKAECPCSGQHR